MKLYTYWRSSAAFRVRIGLALKGLAYDSAFIHLLRDGGEQLSREYSSINPQNLLPSLELGNGDILTQSMAILEYLDETHPTPSFLPSDPFERARVRAMAQAVAIDIHPLNNLRVLNHLTEDLGLSAEQKGDWCRHWIGVGFAGLERMLEVSSEKGDFCFGNAPSLADICLVPQMYNARRFDVDLSPYHNICRIEAKCLELEAFKTAMPENQGDAPPPQS